MTERARREYAEVMRRRYQPADKRERSRLLEEYCRTTGRQCLSAGLVPAPRVRFTRGRPYRKNDQAWVEQRNGLLVRRLVGYDRCTSRAAQAVLQCFYGLLRLQHNFFRPVRKLVSKRRVGSKVIKRYDARRLPTSAS